MRLHGRSLARAATRRGTVGNDPGRDVAGSGAPVDVAVGAAHRGGAHRTGGAVPPAGSPRGGGLPPLAAAHFGVDAGDVAFVDGRVFPSSRPGDGVAFGDVVSKAYLARVPLFAAGFYSTPNLAFDWKTGTGMPYSPGL